MILSLLVLLSLGFSSSFASIESIETKIRSELKQEFPRSQLDLRTFEWTGGMELAQVQDAKVLRENNGVAEVELTDGKRTAHVKVPFSAWLRVPVAKRRILPKEALSEEMFEFQNLDVSKGADRIRKDRILAANEDSLVELESRTTILAGHYPLLHNVKKAPLIRKGDRVQIRILSNGLSLLTSGKALMEGYSGKQVKVISEKTKRRLTGKLNSTGTVEVRL